jgi:hypothetical protein
MINSTKDQLNAMFVLFEGADMIEQMKNWVGIWVGKRVVVGKRGCRQDVLRWLLNPRFMYHSKAGWPNIGPMKTQPNICWSHMNEDSNSTMTRESLDSFMVVGWVFSLFL